MDPISLKAPDMSKTVLARNAKMKENVEEAAQEFESLFLKQMIDEMWKSVPKSGFLSGGRAEEHYYDMFHQQLADDIAKNGGIGLKQVLAEGMRKYEKASSDAAVQHEDS